MSVKKKAKELTTEQKLQNDISGFFQRNLRLIIICASAVALVVLVVVIISASVTGSRNRAMERIQGLEERVTAFSTLEAEEQQQLISDLSAEEKGRGYVSIKASYLKGLAYYMSSEWQNAYDSFMASVDKNNNSYFAPLALVNAASCQEELGHLDAAVDLYSRVTNEYSNTSGVGARALFNTGRIYYQQGNTQLAVSVFNQLIDAYPSSEYTALARNLIVLL